MKGNPPTPVEKRVREGNPQRRPIPEPLLVSGRPDDPNELQPPEDMPESGKQAWREIVPQLVQVGLVDRVDRLALEAMCTQWARFKQAGRVVNAQGHLVRGVSGLREHPSLKTERDAASAFFRIAEHYGLTPIARTRLGLAELHRRQLKSEFEQALGMPDLQPVDVEDAEVIG